jgi:hypothetical protein
MEDESREARIWRGDVLRTWATDSPLDPCKAIAVPLRELYELADRIMEDDDPDADVPVRIPRIPINVAEARAMLVMFNCGGGDWYAGYTNDELEVVGGGSITVTVTPIPES